ncbi:MAG: glycerol-3-phosphate acyltransferase [Ruminococcus sp.]|uniref:glycerol-3-phosphate acyltransferase n=1 Tax=Ruminococcus sp. TaxID=41978 RepID=UPI0025DFABF3|nr:glycerol-3-phosphate acyltransferase [Ruminococcus sp.]MCR4794992.1 glycerol-3-phosphate acyltransferase [Ruminococcus sp.]
MNILICAIMGYCIGGINPAYIIARIKGFDIRKRGSGNAGASNAMMTMGKKVGAFIAVFDIFKAFCAVIIAAKLFPQLKIAKILAGSFCILGHIFPVLMGFRGGKGLACLGGMIMAYDIRIFGILLICELVLGLTLDYVCVIPITGSMIFTTIYAFTTSDPVGTLMLSAISIIVLLKHIENLKRIQNRTEAHISFLWRKDEEIRRIKNNSSN